MRPHRDSLGAEVAGVLGRPAHALRRFSGLNHAANESLIFARDIVYQYIMFDKKSHDVPSSDAGALERWLTFVAEDRAESVPLSSSDGKDSDGGRDADMD
jgi:hypothetical protein